MMRQYSSISRDDIIVHNRMRNDFCHSRRHVATLTRLEAPVDTWPPAGSLLATSDATSERRQAFAVNSSDMTAVILVVLQQRSAAKRRDRRRSPTRYPPDFVHAVQQ
ncbi:hypothetical protein WMF27_43195 [Sorangium sp. So ce281]|uniref:hypothetical protein n=1 Tax=unclassified Sorangium TaxID=2621164 RepID=UPI003F618695